MSGEAAAIAAVSSSASAARAQLDSFLAESRRLIDNATLKRNARVLSLGRAPWRPIPAPRDSQSELRTERIDQGEAVGVILRSATSKARLTRFAQIVGVAETSEEALSSLDTSWGAYRQFWLIDRLLTRAVLLEEDAVKLSQAAEDPFLAPLQVLRAELVTEKAKLLQAFPLETAKLLETSREATHKAVLPSFVNAPQRTLFPKLGADAVMAMQEGAFAAPAVAAPAAASATSAPSAFADALDEPPISDAEAELLAKDQGLNDLLQRVLVGSGRVHAHQLTLDSRVRQLHFPNVANLEDNIAAKGYVSEAPLYAQIQAESWTEFSKRYATSHDVDLTGIGGTLINGNHRAKAIQNLIEKKHPMGEVLQKQWMDIKFLKHDADEHDLIRLGRGQCDNSMRSKLCTFPPATRSYQLLEMSWFALRVRAECVQRSCWTNDVQRPSPPNPHACAGDPGRRRESCGRERSTSKQVQQRSPACRFQDVQAQSATDPRASRTSTCQSQGGDQEASQHVLLVSNSRSGSQRPLSL